MTAEDYLSLFGGFFLWTLPTFVISVWGLWVAVSRRARLGSVATWAITGFALLIAYTLVSAVLRTVLLGIRSNQFLQGGSEAAMAVTTLNNWGLAAYPLYIVGLALVARSVFLGRERLWKPEERMQSVQA